MASRETSIQMAGVLDGEAGSALSPEPLLLCAPSQAAVASEHGHAASVMEAAVVVGGTSKLTIKDAAAAAHAETPCLPGSPSRLYLSQAQLDMPPSISSCNPEMGTAPVLPSESKLEDHIPGEPRLMKKTQHHSWRSLVGGGEAPALLPSDSTRELDRRFDNFKTFSGRLRGLQHGLPPVDIEHGAAPNISSEDTDEENIVPSADRYFAALEGPELETLRVIFYFEAVRREFHHPVRVNFFFAPWIACLFLVKGVPQPVWEIHHIVWYLLMAPILCLDIKIYGQWMSSGERRLSKVANPSNHLAIVGNFVGALLGSRMGLRELPIFFFAIGLAHYVVLFVTLYQRLPTNMQLPKELHPVFFFFIAAPSVASMAWASISGEFNDGAKLLYFISLFLYMSLVVRINLFRGFRFSLSWWAYTFPITSVAVATVLYASEVDNVLMRALAVGLSGIAAVMITGVLATTVYHAFVRKDLFPNDVSIAITQRRPKISKILAHLRSSSSDVKELDLSITSSNSNSKNDTYSGDSCSNSRTSSNSNESPVSHGHV
uniref:S-type anion channel SLAH2 n=1 Tax=Aegilops tauschii TaxID=37682 RepID=N1QPY0_AEGTA